MSFLMPDLQWVKPQLNQSILRGITAITQQRVGLGGMSLQYRGPRQDFTADIQKMYQASGVMELGSGSTRGLNYNLPNVPNLSALQGALRRSGVTNPSRLLRDMLNGQIDAPILATHKGRTRVISGEPYLIMARFFGANPNVVHLNLDDVKSKE